MITIDTTDFEFAWGRKPRGRGLWIFSTVRPSSTGEALADNVGTIHCNAGYKVARQAAERAAKEAGIRTLYVCP